MSADIKMTDLDFDMVVDSTMCARTLWRRSVGFVLIEPCGCSGRRSKSMTIDVRPVMMTYEQFYCGFIKGLK